MERIYNGENGMTETSGIQDVRDSTCIQTLINDKKCNVGGLKISGRQETSRLQYLDENR